MVGQRRRRLPTAKLTSGGCLGDCAAVMARGILFCLSVCQLARGVFVNCMPSFFVRYTKGQGSSATLVLANIKRSTCVDTQFMRKIA